MKEIWKDCKHYEGLYEVSNLGRVRSLDRYVANSGKSERLTKGRIISQHSGSSGYLQVGLSKNGKTKYELVHRLVALAFLENPENLPQVNHKDECKTNNEVSNLEWCDRKYNLNYGTVKQRISTKHTKRINQYDLEGNYIATYSSQQEAAKQTGISNASVHYCCTGKTKQAGGYIWQFV
jgi:hypothetical protein